MFERLPERRHVRRLSLLAIAVILTTAFPALFPSAAAMPSFKPLDDTQGQFSEGSFQRTAISSGGSSIFKDGDGAVQLTAVGDLNPWDVATPDLPVPLASMGVTTIGNRLYTVAGSTDVVDYSDAVYWATADQENGSFKDHGFTDTNKPGGSFVDNPVWVNDPLPSAAAYMGLGPNPDCNAVPIRARRGPAVASYVASSTTAYIYAIGGAFLPDSQSLCSPNVVTSPVVQRGTVDLSNGDIAWTKDSDLLGSYLPSQDLPNAPGETWDNPAYFTGVQQYALGVEGAAAAIMRASDGKTYLYVIGGVVSYYTGRAAAGMVTPAVFYTRLSAENPGEFENPKGLTGTGTPWVRTANVPLNRVYSGGGSVPQPGLLGIYNHMAMVSRSTVGTTNGGTTVSEAIFVTGGYTADPRNSPNANAFVFRAMFDDAKGSGEIKWDTVLNPAQPSQNVSTDGDGRGAGAGFAYGSKLYVIGGLKQYGSSGPPMGTVSTGIHDDNMNMVPLFGSTETPEYFIGSGGSDVVDKVYGLGAGVIPAVPIAGSSNQNAAWGYAVGGYATGGDPTAKIFVGPIGGPQETEATKRAPEGWFYSRPHDIQLAGEGDTKTEARVLSIRWFSEINRTQNQQADIYLEFRRTTNLPCNEAAFAGAQWVRLDANASPDFYSGGDSAVNQVKLSAVFPNENFNARCFQYRVFMTQNGSTAGVPNAAGNNTVTPKLYKVDVETTKPGDPDLRIEAFDIGVNGKGQFSTFNLQIRNLNETIAKTAEAPEGEFPVVLCVEYRALDQPKPTLSVPTLPITGADRVTCAPVYRWINWTETDPLRQPFAVNNEWRANSTVPDRGLIQDELVPNGIYGYFNVPGHYAVAALIDPFNYVPEAGAGKTDNRGENLNGGQALIHEFTVLVPGYSTYLPLSVR